MIPVPSHRTYDQVRRGVAFHEAGHAVLAMVYGMHVVSSEIIARFPEPGLSQVTGCTNVSPPADFDVWHFAEQCAAGEIAEVAHLMAAGLWTPERAKACSAPHDRDLAVDVLAARGFTISEDVVPVDGKTWAMVRGMARRKVTHLWPHIHAVAMAMNERTVLTGDDIADLTGLMNPEVAA
ncbi:hypothetical protein [Streptomyces sp. NPDC001297]|uniref:hypothetical protein n=1 Tax=Streptomyces sp. NPDC001297 TaxID=3364559 RepID=UPI0036C6380F